MEITQSPYQNKLNVPYKQIYLGDEMEVQNVEFIVNYQNGRPEIISIVNNRNIMEVYKCRMNVDPNDREVDKVLSIDVINYYLYQQIIRKVVTQNEVRILKMKIFYNCMVFVLTSDGILRLINLYSRRIVQSVQLNDLNNEVMVNNEYEIQFDTIGMGNGEFMTLVAVQRLNLENQSLHLVELSIQLKLRDLEISSLEQIN